MKKSEINITEETLGQFAVATRDIMLATDKWLDAIKACGFREVCKDEIDLWLMSGSLMVDSLMALVDEHLSKDDDNEKQ